MIENDIKNVETYKTLTKEMFLEVIKELSKPMPKTPELKFPTTEEIEALDDNLTYSIPTPCGYVWMSGKGAKEFKKQLIKEINGK
jgi:hypothetical protein